MESRLKAIIQCIFRQYGADDIQALYRQKRILDLCMNELSAHPMLRQRLDTSAKLHYYVIQTILRDSPAKVPVNY